MKKPINTKLHGLLDYMIGSGLVLPWVMNYYKSDTDTWLLAAIGTLIFIINLMTNYELSFIKLIPMKVHLFLDVLLGLLLIVLPYFYPLPHYYFYWPVILGISELFTVVFSSSEPYVVTKKDLNIIGP